MDMARSQHDNTSILRGSKPTRQPLEWTVLETNVAGLTPNLPRSKDRTWLEAQNDMRLVIVDHLHFTVLRTFVASRPLDQEIDHRLPRVCLP